MLIPVDDAVVVANNANIDAGCCSMLLPNVDAMPRLI
jgi:hypothetical protein